MLGDGTRARAPISERRLALKAADSIGTWRLRCWKNVASDGSAVDPPGERPVGYIFYNHDGFRCVESMAAHRAPYQEPDAFGGTPEERSEAISIYFSYSGPFEGLPDRDTVIHHIEVCSYSNCIGNALAW
jgi:Lipocalin-like domain